MIQAKEMMTESLTTIGADQPMYLAQELMRSSRIRHLPVVDETGDIVGVLSDRDVQRAMVSSMVEDDRGILVEETSLPAGRQVADYMARQIRFLDADVELAAVARCMVDEKISCVLLSRGGKIVGLLTSEDLLKFLLARFEETWDESDITAGTILDERYIGSP